VQNHRTNRDGGALVVLSGGQDSVTCLGWALELYGRVGCVTFDYGQKHSREIDAASEAVEHYRRKIRHQIPHEVVHIAGLLGTSPLTNRKEPLETYQDAEVMAAVIGDRVEKTFVPVRNTIFLAYAANRAVAEGYADIVTGVCQEDNANYPDCTQVFLDSMQDALDAGLGGPVVSLHAPLMNLTKAETVRLAYETPHAYEALAWSHTAYDGQYPPTGKDHASLLRAQGFEQAGLPDPLVLRAWDAGLMALPAGRAYEDHEYIASFVEANREDWH